MLVERPAQSAWRYRIGGPSGLAQRSPQAVRAISAGPRWRPFAVSTYSYCPGRFARYLAYVDERTEVPPADVLPARSHRVSPYLYSEDQVRSLMAAAQGCFPSPLRKATFSTMVGLFYASGMRVGEALRLAHADVDFTNNFVLVRRSKFNSPGNCPCTARQLQRISGPSPPLGTH